MWSLLATGKIKMEITIQPITFITESIKLSKIRKLCDKDLLTSVAKFLKLSIVSVLQLRLRKAKSSKSQYVVYSQSCSWVRDLFI